MKVICGLPSKVRVAAVIFKLCAEARHAVPEKAKAAQIRHNSNLA